MNLRLFFSYSLVAVGALLLSVGIQAHAAFTEPSTSPPNANVEAPLTGGATAQSKAGGLLLNTGGATNGLIVQYGNVGIGVTDPSYKLDVKGSAWNNITRIYSTGGSSGIEFYDTAVRRGVVYSDSSGFGLLNNGTSWALRVNHGTTDIYIPGSVGIGTASPGQALDVNGNIRSRSGNWQSYTGAAYVTAYHDALSYRFDVSGSPKMTIDTAGNVGIGVGPSYKMDVLGVINTKGTSASWASGGIRIEKGDSTAYRWLYINSTGGQLRFYNGVNEPYIDDNGVWNNASDISLKKDVVDIKYGLNEIMKLQPRSYLMKSNDDAQIGFIAQEVEKIIPEVVSGEEGKKGMSYGNLEALTIRGIQEQQQIIMSQQKKISELEARLTALEEKLSR